MSRDPTQIAIDTMTKARAAIETVKIGGTSPNNRGGLILEFKALGFDCELEVEADGTTDLTLYQDGLMVTSDLFVAEPA